MKRKVSLLLAVSLMCALVFPVPMVQAANSKIVYLKENRTYRYDLNGDKKKEKIKVKCTVSGYSNATIQLYVNGKRIFSRKRDSLGAKFYLVDLNKKDKYKELLVHGLSDSGTTGDFFAVRYKGNNKKSVLEGATQNGRKLRSNSKQLNLYRFTLYSNTGQNKLYIKADTPYSNFYFGSYYVKVPVVIKNGKLTAQKSSSYRALGQTRSYLYRLKRSMALYEKASTSSSSVICYSGSSFHALELKPAQNSDTGGLYVKVKMSSGKTGWLYFPSYSSYDIGYLENVPAWG